ETGSGRRAGVPDELSANLTLPDQVRVARDPGAIALRESFAATRSRRGSSAPLLRWTVHDSFCLLAQSLSRSAALKALCSNCVLSPAHQRNRRSRQDIRLSSCGAGTLRTQGKPFPDWPLTRCSQS